MAGHANLTLRTTQARSQPADEQPAVRTGLTCPVTRSDGTAVAVISGAYMIVGRDPAQCSYTIQDLPMASESGTPYTYTVTETAHAAPAAVLYLASRAAVNGDALQPAGDLPTLANITLLQNGTTYADFENTYARQTGSLRLTKAVDDTALRDEAEAVKMKVAEMKEANKKLEEDMAAAEAGITEILLSVPNTPCDMVPEGRTAEDNVVERSGGIMPEQTADRKPQFEL